MVLADIDLTNLDLKPLLKKQVSNLIDVLYSIYPEINVYFYALLDEKTFSLQDLPTNQGQVIGSISTKDPIIARLQAQEVSSSIILQNKECADLFSQNSGEMFNHSIISPIGDQGELAGFLVTILPLESNPEEINLDLFNSVASSMGQHTVTSNLLKKYKGRSNHLSVMLEVNTHLNIAATKIDFLSEISRFGKYFLHFDRAVLILHPEATPEYFIIDSIEGDRTGLQQGMSYPVFNSLVSMAIITGQYFIFKKSHLELPTGIYRTGDFEEYNYDQVICFPLAKEKNGPGVLVLESHEEHAIEKSEISIFEMISQSLGAALNRFSLYEQLNNYATIDSLTHLYNLRALQQRFEEELARAGRYQNSLVVLFLDLDKFKLINDNHGHLMGDYVLRETSQIIRDSIRTSDIPGRYGGEEFVVIMVNADAEACMASARRLCSAIRDHKYAMNETVVKNKVSIGLSEYPQDGKTMQELIQSADAAMYTAKRQGGDQVIKYLEGMVPKSQD